MILMIYFLKNWRYKLLILTNEEIKEGLENLPYIKKDFSNYEDLNDSYYHVLSDILKYYKCWCYVVWSKRGPGKTYSMLWLAYYSNFPIIYMKRTDKDVERILKEEKSINLDASPYAPLKKQKNIRVAGSKIDDGFGAFYEADNEGQPTGRLLCYVLSFNKVNTYKGNDFSDVEILCFDEFIPQLGDRIKRSEGELLLDLYQTVARDRIKKGRQPLKLILFANAEQISVPVTQELEIIDQMADLNTSDKTHLYIEDRDILLHHITDAEVPITENEKQGIWKGMQGTSWFDKSFGGHFVHNDFSNVTKRSLKRSRPLLQIKYKTHFYYIYLNEEKAFYYMTSTAAKTQFSYDLNRENEQKKFYYDYLLDLREACIEERFKFEKYSMYDLIINYKKYFDIGY